MTFTTNLEMIDLMDELKRKDVIARRLALAFTFCCATTSGSAGEIDSKPAQGSSMSQLLAQGWGSPAPLRPLESIPAENLISADPLGPSVFRSESQAAQYEDRAPSIVSESGKSVVATATTVQHEQPAPSDSLADLISRGANRQSIQGQELQSLLPEAEAQPLVVPTVPSSSESKTLLEDEVVNSIEDVANSESLADFLRAHRDLVLNSIPTSGGSQIAQDKELCNEDDFTAPTRRPLPTRVESSSSMAHTRLRVQAAPEITTEPTTLREPNSAGNDSTGLNASVRRNVQRAIPAMRPSSNIPTFVSVPPRIVSVPDELRPPSPSKQKPSEREVATDLSVNASDDPTATRPGLAQKSVADHVPNEPPAPLRDPSASPSELDSLLAGDGVRRDDEDEYAILPIPSLESGRSYVPPTPIPPPTPSVTLHTTRLLELAQHSIHRSQQSLQRGATHTARKHAIEAMQAIVALRDAQEGGNRHSLELDRAFDAIRESKDFCGEFGSIDSQALGRMVIVHETAVLKEQDLGVITALEATETYLDFAKDQLALAAGGIREGSQALLLLGQIELQLAKATDAHSTSVAVAVQRAAVEADPYYAIGYRVLGTTLLNLGLAEEAADCLITSLQIQPTRMAYERLLDVARRLGDVDTARTCMKALEDPRMEEGSLVRSLTPQEFAATNRPVSTSIQTPRTRSKSETTGAQSQPAARIGFSSLFPFGRR